MSAYEPVSRIFDNWVSQSGVRFYGDVRGFPREHRFAYVSSGRGERCQIEVEAPTRGVITVHVREIESIGEDQLSEVWRVTISELGSALNEAKNLIENWFARHVHKF